MVTYPLVLTNVVSALFTYYGFFVNQSGHPVLLVTSAINILLCAWLLLAYHYNFLHWSQFVLYVYFYNHAIGSILVYMDWLPDSFTKYPKFHFEWQLYLNYCLVMAMPLNEYGTSFIMTTPLLIAGIYFKTLGESRILEQYREYLPEELSSEIRPFNVMLSNSVYKMMVLAVCYLYFHYIQQLVRSTLILDKLNVAKGQEQLYEFLNNQKDAIILFKIERE